MINNTYCSVQNLSISYSHHTNIFSDVSFSVEKGTIFGIYGSNGTGKSTLLKALAHILSPSTGRIELCINGEIITKELTHKNVGVVAPYLTLYDEFTLDELVSIITRLRGLTLNTDYYHHLLNKFYLFHKKEDKVKEFSSGMVQRVRFILATVHQPTFLLLDEPTTNLDESGIDSVFSIINDTKTNNGVVCIATNEKREKNWCTDFIDVSNFAK